MTEGKWRDLLCSTVILTGVSLGLSATHTAHAATSASPQPATTQPTDAPANISTAPATGKVAPATPTATATPLTSGEPVQATPATPTAADPAEQPAASEEAVTNAAVTPSADPAPADKTVSTTTPAPTTATTTTAPTTVPEVKPGDDFGDTHQVAVTNVQDYQATSNKAIDWHNYHYIAAAGLTKDSPLGFQVNKFAATYKAATGTELQVLTTVATGLAGVIQLNAADQSIQNAEDYTITIAANSMAINARTAQGAFYALTTLSQMAQSGQALPEGIITDAPEVGLREVSVDCGRKYYSKQWFLDLIDEMAASKANDLTMHFSDIKGFMLESKTHPEIMSPEYLTQDEVKEIIAYAKLNFITITPELDMPGHLGQVLKAHPEFKLVAKSSVPAFANYLDVTNSDAVDFMKSLIDEFAGVFGDSSPYFNIGGDEFLQNDFSTATMKRSFPKLYNYAVAKYGDQANGVEAFYDFLNEMDEYVQSKGYATMIFHDRIYRSDDTSLVSLNKDMVVKYWTHCRTPMPTLQTIIDEGHKIVNYDDGYLYYVLGENAGYTYPQADKIYNGWDNGVFAGVQGDGKIDGKSFAQTIDHTKLTDQFLGSAISIWSDNYDAQTEDEVARDFAAPFRAFAQKAWGVDDSISFDDFAAFKVRVDATAITAADLAKVAWDPAVTKTGVGDGVSVEAGGYYENTKLTDAPAATTEDSDEQSPLPEGEDTMLRSGDVVTMPAVASVSQRGIVKTKGSSSANTDSGHKVDREYPQTGDIQSQSLLISVMGTLTILLGVLGMGEVRKHIV